MTTGIASRPNTEKGRKMKNKQKFVTTRLAVAVDLYGQTSDPDDIYARDCLRRMLLLLEPLAGQDLTIKVESILDVCGYGVINSIHAAGFRAFADLKAYGTPNALSEKGRLLRSYQPKFATIACSCGLDSVKAFKQELPDAQVLGVFSLTHIPYVDTIDFGARESARDVVMDLVWAELENGLDGLICSAGQIPYLRKRFGDRITLNVTNVRFDGKSVPGDDQAASRTSTPCEAVSAGANLVIMGRPITLSRDPLVSTQRALNQITRALL